MEEEQSARAMNLLRLDTLKARADELEARVELAADDVAILAKAAQEMEHLGHFLRSYPEDNQNAQTALEAY